MQPMLTLISFELERAFTRRQSLLYLSAFAFLWYLVIRFAVLNLTELVAPNVSQIEWAELALQNYFKIALYLFCLLSMLACANQTCSDRVRGTLRFLSLRCSRFEIYTARFLAQLCIFSILIIACSSAVLIVLFYYSEFSLALLMSGLIYSCVLIVSISPFVALMALLSAWLDSARKASVTAVFIWAMAASIIAALSHYLPVLSSLVYLVPGSQFNTLLEYQGLALVLQSYISLIQSLVLFGFGFFMMKRNAL